QTRAPLNEALAAAIVQRTGWRGSMPFVDPLCGSGTLCIEAAWIALDRPPGLTRRRFGFMGWMDYDVGLWTGLRDQARAGVKKTLPVPIHGSDIRKDAVDFARTSARAAGIGHLLRFDRLDLRDARPPEGPPGILLCNPPYGERIGDERELQSLYRALGESFQEHWPGWTLFVFTGNARLARRIGLKARREIHLFNGRIPCRLLEYSAASPSAASPGA